MIQGEWRVAQPTPRPLPPVTDGLLEDGLNAIPVRIRIVQDGVQTGWDDGALGFDETSFWFSGLATSFRIRAPEIEPGTYYLSREEAVTEGEAKLQGFPLRHPLRQVAVRMEVLSIEGRDRDADERRLVGEVCRLRSPHRSGDEEEGKSQYPPLTPRPGIYRNFSTSHLTIGFVIVLVVLVGLWAYLFLILKERFFSALLIMMISLSNLLTGRIFEGKDGPVLRRIAREEAERSASA